MLSVRHIYCDSRFKDRKSSRKYSWDCILAKSSDFECSSCQENILTLSKQLTVLILKTLSNLNDSVILKQGWSLL